MGKKILLPCVKMIRLHIKNVLLTIMYSMVCDAAKDLCITEEAVIIQYAKKE